MDKSYQKDRLEHIKNAILLIKLFVENQSETDFLNDIKGQNATLFQFLIIGEAIKNIDNSILDKYNYPWHIPRSFRNFIAHEYHKIRLEIVYKAAFDLDSLLKIIDEILDKEF
ncbi:MAG: hypothetical protein A2046_07750 [Bacteroidetes bacterium GWA2_30_7]|nr:MAG: hypothetical protein A2046_07750 [Bacteroidetes bacterium GWA2_30_7]